MPRRLTPAGNRGREPFNDDPRQVQEILERLGEVGVTDVGGIGLHLRRDVKEIWFDWLRQHRPELLPRYEELYGNGAYLPREEAGRLSKLARGDSKPRRWRVRDPDPEKAPKSGPAPAAQPTLF